MVLLFWLPALNEAMTDVLSLHHRPSLGSFRNLYIASRRFFSLTGVLLVYQCPVFGASVGGSLNAMLWITCELWRFRRWDCSGRRSTLQHPPRNYSIRLHRHYDVRGLAPVNNYQICFLNERLIIRLRQDIDGDAAGRIAVHGSKLRKRFSLLQHSIEVQRSGIEPVRCDIGDAVSVIEPCQYGINVLHIRVPLILLEIGQA